MKLLINLSMSMLALFIFTSCAAQIPNAKTDTIKVYGNCGMCEKTIEKAAYKKGEAKADWDQDSKMAVITYNGSLTNVDVVLQRIAAAGYDSDKFTAPNEAYNNLPGCCQYDRPKKEDGATGMTTTPVSEQPASENPVAETPASATKQMDQMVKKEASTQAAVSPLADVYTAYFALKDALVATDGNTTVAQANSLFKAVGDVKMDALTAAQHGVWMKYQQKLSKDAEQIKGITDTEHQREYFASLSKNMYEVMKVIKPETAVYFDHCPMYNDGKGGDWLSTEKPIKNPYYGKKMLTCGSVTETLK